MIDDRIIKMIEGRIIHKNSLVCHFVDKNKKIIDIGSGATPMFGDKSTNVDKTPLSYFRKKFKDDNFNIPNFVEANAEDLPFKDREFDFALLSEVLEHVDDPVKVLDEAQRVASIIVIVVPLEYQWSEDNKPFTNKGHKRFFDESSLCKLINDSGLIPMELIKIYVSGWSHFVFVGISKYEDKKE